MTDQWQLADAAKHCRDLHKEHHFSLYEKKQAVRTERMINPGYGPRDVLDINALSDHDELINERAGDERDVPGGLMLMVQDAAFYTDAPYTVFRQNGEELCEFVRQHAYEIAENFPAAQELLELLHTQAAWITRQLDSRPTTIQAMQTKHGLNLHSGWGTAAELAPLVSEYVGKKVTNLKITEVGRGKKFRVTKNAKGISVYNLQEMVDHFQSA